MFGKGQKRDEKGMDFVAIQEGDLDSCLKSMLRKGEGEWFSVDGYTAYGENGEELPNMELFAETLEFLKDAETVKMRIKVEYPPISVKEVDEATEDLFMVGQFVLLEGHLSEKAEEWLRGMQFAVKTAQCLVAIAQVEEDLPEENLMYAMYAAYLDLPLENIAIITKKDD